jgi:uncharacterized repeat protein (TIGR01451 family)
LEAEGAIAMSRPGWNRRAGARNARLALKLALAIAGALGFASTANAQATPPAVTSTPAVEAPGSAVVGPSAGEANIVATPREPALPSDIQVVRFHGPAGVKVEVIGPAPEAVPVGDNHGLLTVGLKVGTPYRLRITNMPDHPGAELFPVIEMVGHLHRPAAIDPAKYPVRIMISEQDIEDAVDRGRLVTQVIYLEDPDQALPISLPKDQIPFVSLSPSEDPLRVAAALGRVMAILRIGGRRPITPVELNGDTLGAYNGAWTPCPFSADESGGKCGVSCGPVCGNAPPPGRPWLPKDEYLCDGGDRGDPARFAGDGNLAGIDPRDAVIQFDDGRKTRALPTNMVCVYAPRFGEVRVAVGPNEALLVEGSAGLKRVENQAVETAKVGPKRMTQNQSAEAERVRMRASGLASRTRAGIHAEFIKPNGYDGINSIAIARKEQEAVIALNRMKAQSFRDRAKFQGIKTAESAVIRGLIAGAGQTVMSWTPQETVGVETPPNRPGLAVLKRVSAGEAEPGDKLTYVIQYRNMGNTPIRDVTIHDSLLPRLDYVRGSAKGPKGTTFTADENKAAATELKWVLPEPIAPGASGYVSFEAMVR